MSANWNLQILKRVISKYNGYIFKQNQSIPLMNWEITTIFEVGDLSLV